MFACAAAIAALQHLKNLQAELDPIEGPLHSVTIDLINPPQTVEIAIEQVAKLGAGTALAISRSDPGDNLDITRDTPIWAVVTWAEDQQLDTIVIEGGEGIGKLSSANDRAAIYAYAQHLLQTNLQKLLNSTEKIRVTIILPEGRSLAQRTSNAAFGIVDGLSLLGTSGISQPLSAPEQLEQFQTQLRQKAEQRKHLVFCLGENGLDLAQKLGIDAACLIKTANWIGPMLVEASLQGVEGVLLLGYHGKLIKLAGGIFHTHHYVADARQEILTAYAATLGLPQTDLNVVFNSPTTEAALQHLRHLDQTTGSQWVAQIYTELARQIDQRSQTYIQSQTNRRVIIGSILFDQQRQIIVSSFGGTVLREQVTMA